MVGGVVNPKAFDNFKGQNTSRDSLNEPYYDTASDLSEDAPVSVEKFFKQRAVNIAVGGSYTLANWYNRQGKPRSFACRTTRVSPFIVSANMNEGAELAKALPIKKAGGLATRRLLNSQLSAA
jgi:hypothetical protein